MDEFAFYTYSFIWFFLGVAVIIGLRQLLRRLRKDDTHYTSKHTPRLVEFLMGLLLFIGIAGHLGIGFSGGWSPENAPRLLAQIALWDVAILAVYAVILLAINRFMTVF